MRRAAWRRWGGVSLLAATGVSGHTQGAAPSGSERPVLTLRAHGVQIYTCAAAAESAGAQAGSATWVLKAPDADLADEGGRVVGHHGAGPVWRYQDGSAVYGTLLSRRDAPEAGAIPWLVLRATRWEGEGVLRKVTTIRREETHGGTAPATGCDASHLNAERRVPYAAAYRFYGEGERPTEGPEKAR